MKKFYSLLVIICTLNLCLFGCSNTVTDISDFKYTTIEDFVVINGYIGEEKEIVIPNKIDGKPVTYVGSNAFTSCNLEKVTIPDSVKKIGEMAFANCQKLHTVNLSDNITEIGAEAFRKCVNLKKIKLPSELIKIDGYAFAECENIERISIPKTVTFMGMGAFLGNKSLSEVEFEQGIKKIGSFATFQACSSLKSITIPSGVEEIGEATFSTCESLKTVKFLGDAPSKIGSNAFGTPSKDVTIYFSKKTFGWNDTLLDDYKLIEY